MSSKTAFKTIAESMLNGKFGKANLPTDSVDHRKLSIDEIKVIVKEELGKAVAKASDVHPQEEPGGWGDAKLEKEIEWAKKLELENFIPKKKE
jgi:hypothetical protein